MHKQLNKLINKRYNIPTFPRKRHTEAPERPEYTIIRHTKQGDIIDIKPEVLKIIKKRLQEQ